MKRVLKYLVLMFILAAFIPKPVFAEPTSEQVQSQREELQADKNELKKAQDIRFQIEQKIENLDNSIEKIIEQIQTNKNQMLKVQEDIKVNEKQYKQAEEDLKNEQEVFNKRVRAMYINGVGAYLQVLVQAQGFSDFISRVEAVRSIMKLDKKITESIKLKQEQLNTTKQALNKKNQELVTLNAENNKKIDKLKLDKSDQSKLIEEAKRQERLYASAVNESQTKLNETMKQIETIRKATPKYTPSRGAVSVSSNAVVAYASNFLGTPYLWGGTTPAGFDCSGFTQYVYRHFGISLGRTTYDQINDGYAVSRDQLQSGDLVFYGKGGSPSHMGIYIGNGMYMHAPRTGDVIKISPYDRADYITARRVMR
jgi:cell wall-associated NlpC family hydrolase